MVKLELVPPGTLTVGSATANEASGVITFPVSIVGVPPATSFTVQLAPAIFASDTATVGLDVANTMVSRTWNPGDPTTFTMSLPLINDTLVESTEQFHVFITAVGIGVSGGGAVGTIIDDDATTPQLSVSDVSAAEGNSGVTTLAVPVTVSLPVTAATTVAYTVSGGSATPGTDFVATSGTVTIPAGGTTVSIPVSVIGDTTPEPDETFIVTITGTTPAVAIVRGTATGTILNDDGSTCTPPTATIVPTHTFVWEKGIGQTSTLTFTVTLSGPACSDTVVAVTPSGTATLGSDYTLSSLNFAPGDTSKTLTMTVIGDRNREGVQVPGKRYRAEYATLTLTGGSSTTVEIREVGIG